MVTSINGVNGTWSPVKSQTSPNILIVRSLVSNSNSNGAVFASGNCLMYIHDLENGVYEFRL